MGTVPASGLLPAPDADPGRVARLRAEHPGAEGKLQPATPRNGPSTTDHPSSPWRGEPRLRSGRSQPRSMAPRHDAPCSDVSAVQAPTC